MRVAHRNTKFRHQWKDSFKWLDGVKDDPFSAKCTICECVFRINSSGITQVKNHSATKKHETLWKESTLKGKLISDANNNVSLKTGKLYRMEKSNRKVRNVLSNENISVLFFIFFSSFFVSLLYYRTCFCSFV